MDRPTSLLKRMQRTGERPAEEKRKGELRGGRGDMKGIMAQEFYIEKEGERELL